MASRIWILGAADPEMDAIEALLRECGERVEYAESVRGQRARPANADASPLPQAAADVALAGGTVYLAECCVLPMWGEHSDRVRAQCVRIDHHRPGDPGYGRPPAEFLAASSLGQVISTLHGPLHSYEIPRSLVLIAAADHCLGAAYAGQCPGVDPDELMRWRAESRARFQGRDVSEVVADIERAQKELKSAPSINLRAGEPLVGVVPSQWLSVADMRRDTPIAELVEAATRLGIGYVSGPLIGPDGRSKYTISGTAAQVRTFLDHWAPAQGLVDSYGDPARGFAGGYEP